MDKDTKIEIAKATPSMLADVRAFYHEMIDAMQGTDFDVLWEHGEHPSDEYIAERTNSGELFVGMIDDPQPRIVCALAVDHESEFGFECVNWANDVPYEKVWVVHIVATHPDFHGQGLATRLLSAVIENAKRSGIESVRLDVFEHNNRARGLYEKVGFSCLGVQDIYYPYLGTIKPCIYEYALG